MTKSPKGGRGLEQALGYEFKDNKLIIEALTHRSHYHEFGDSSSNERLEFLGDTVLDLVITEELMRLFPQSGEGALSKLRSQIVSERSLSLAAKNIGLGKVLRLGKGEDKSGGRDRDSLLADCLEAVIAAVYLDGGLEEARKMILQKLGLQLPTQSSTKRSNRFFDRDYKSRLQELCQSFGLGTPNYHCLSTEGPDHKKLFTMSLTVVGVELVKAKGPTKKEATQEAARLCLENLGENPDLKALINQKTKVPKTEESTKEVEKTK
jgi:ribonuclease-3